MDVEWIEGCFDKEVSSFVYRRRTGLSRVTFLKVGWVKIRKFLPRGLTQGELGKIEPSGVPLEVWAGFGIGILVLAPKFPYVVSIPATHTRNSSHSTNSFALQRGHRTPQLGTCTYYKIHALCKIFALHKIFVLGDFSFLRYFFLFSFFLAKIAWNHVFWNMGKVAVSRETSVVAHTIAFQAILAQKNKTKKSSAGWIVIIFWYMMEKNWCWIHGEGRRGPRILFYFRIPEN